jgi:hypothetical protein
MSPPMPARFPKPSFDALVTSYETERDSVHDCPGLYGKKPIPPHINTCALRVAEALVLANGLVASRDAITALTARAGNGKAFLLGPYGYAANLCPHGIARGPRDLAHFLRQQWGDPDRTWPAQKGGEGSRPDDARGERGVMAFVKIPSYEGQGHIDVWNGDAAIGHAYWNAAEILLWRLA